MPRGWRACTADQGHTSPGGGATPVRDRRARRGLRGTGSGSHRRPRYTWGKRGTVVGYHFSAVLPERSARGEHGAGEHFYTVEFDGRELWGDDAEPGTASGSISSRAIWRRRHDR